LTGMEQRNRRITLWRRSVTRLVRNFVFAFCLVAACSAARADTLVRVFAIRGFAGVAFSRGMNILCDELASMPDVRCTVEDFYEESAIKAKAADALAAGQRLVLVGHSLGAHAALAIAGEMNGSVSLVVTIDPNWFAPPAVPANIEVVLNYYQNFDVLGRAQLTAPAGFQGELEQFLIDRPHVLIDRTPEIHTEIINRIKQMLVIPPPMAGAPAPARSNGGMRDR
jgi:pimeloyl-ACP methyl ester carboxylesterase